MSKSYERPRYEFDDNYKAWKRQRQKEQEEREYCSCHNDYDDEEEMYNYKIGR